MSSLVNKLSDFFHQVNSLNPVVSPEEIKQIALDELADVYVAGGDFISFNSHTSYPMFSQLVAGGGS